MIISKIKWKGRRTICLELKGYTTTALTATNTGGMWRMIFWRGKEKAFTSGLVESSTARPYARIVRREGGNMTTEAKDKVSTGEIQQGNLEQAKERCKDCFALIDKDGVWWCDEADSRIQDVITCKEWEV